MLVVRRPDGDGGHGLESFFTGRQRRAGRPEVHLRAAHTSALTSGTALHEFIEYGWDNAFVDRFGVGLGNIPKKCINDNNASYHSVSIIIDIFKTAMGKKKKV